MQNTRADVAKVIVFTIIMFAIIGGAIALAGAIVKDQMEQRDKRGTDNEDHWSM